MGLTRSHSPSSQFLLKWSAQKFWNSHGTLPLWKGGANYIPQTTGAGGKGVTTYREGKSLLPHSLKTNQFKSHTVLPIILCLMTVALKTV